MSEECQRIAPYRPSLRAKREQAYLDILIRVLDYSNTNKNPRRTIWKAHNEVRLAPAVYEAICILALEIGSSTTIYATGF